MARQPERKEMIERAEEFMRQWPFDRLWDLLQDGEFLIDDEVKEDVYQQVLKGYATIQVEGTLFQEGSKYKVVLFIDGEPPFELIDIQDDPV